MLTLPVRDSLQQAFTKNPHDWSRTKLKRKVALSKALFSLRRRSGFGAKEAWLPPCAGKKAKSRHAVKRDGFSGL
jgi:hypothetical protein